MHPIPSSSELLDLCAQIDQLRTQLENAVLACAIEETLALSQSLDALLNRLMLSRSRRLRRRSLCAPATPHVYCARTSAPHVSTDSGAHIFPFYCEALLSCSEPIM